MSVISDSFSIDCCPGVPLPSAPSPNSMPANRVSAETVEPDQLHFDHRNSVYQSASARGHFESADTDRLNETHWTYANQEIPANDDLHLQLPIMRARSNHEANNNPTIEGLMLSHTLAVAGENGPLLDLQGEDEAADRWCEQAEQVWENWCLVADAAGELGIGSLIKQWNFSCWRNGEFLEQFVNEDREFRQPDVPQLRLHGIEPQRLLTPTDEASNPDVKLGVRRNSHRRAVAYYISDAYHGYGFTNKGRWIGARNIAHGMDRVQAERGQARGTPWAQWGLPTSADARDYDLQVLDAARSAADANIIAFTRHPDAEFADNVPASIRFRRRSINFLAPGWESQQTHPTQPGANYKDHRQELHGDLGKPKGVPSMITRLDARDHNYSSARFDYQLLGESAKHVRSTLYNPQLRRLALLVISEAVLMGVLPPLPPRIIMEWVWPNLPEIDEMKSAQAEQLLMKIGTLTYTEACANRHGRRARDQARRRARDDRMLQNEGLPTVAEASSSSSGNTSGDTTRDMDSEDQE